MRVALPRIRVPERMDAPDIDGPAHLAALRGLARLNRLARSDRILWTALESLARAGAHGSSRALRALDVATGSGDIPTALAGRARREGLPFEWHALEASARAAGAARDRAARAGAALTVHVGDALAGPLPAPGRFDAVTCSLFLHHLDPPGAARALRAMSEGAERLLLVSDLRRTRLGLALAWIVPRLLALSPVVRFDAVASVRAAYTPAELRALAAEAGLRGATVRRVWPQRMLLTWSRPA